MTNDYMVTVPTKKQGISVIASFSTNGDIMPLYFQTVENEEKYSFRVRVIGKKENNVIYSFNCTYNHVGIEKHVCLNYWIRDHIWTI